MPWRFRYFFLFVFTKEKRMTIVVMTFWLSVCVVRAFSWQSPLVPVTSLYARARTRHLSRSLVRNQSLTFRTVRSFFQFAMKTSFFSFSFYANIYNRSKALTVYDLTNKARAWPLRQNDNGSRRQCMETCYTATFDVGLPSFLISLAFLSTIRSLI